MFGWNGVGVSVKFICCTASLFPVLYLEDETFLGVLGSLSLSSSMLEASPRYVEHSKKFQRAHCLVEIIQFICLEDAEWK